MLELEILSYFGIFVTLRFFKRLSISRLDLTTVTSVLIVSLHDSMFLLSPLCYMEIGQIVRMTALVFIVWKVHQFYHLATLHIFLLV